MSDPFYGMSDDQEIARRRRERAVEDLRSMVERIIDDAQAKGAFENLPGQGKPLPLDDHNPFARDRELAYKLLKDNNYTLPWIDNRNDVLAKIEAFRIELRRSWTQYHQRYQSALGDAIRAALRLKWRQRYQELTETVALLNQDIAGLNLHMPVSRLEIIKLDLDRELGVFGGAPDLEE